MLVEVREVVEREVLLDVPCLGKVAHVRLDGLLVGQDLDGCGAGGRDVVISGDHQEEAAGGAQRVRQRRGAQVEHLDGRLGRLGVDEEGGRGGGGEVGEGEREVRVGEGELWRPAGGVEVDELAVVFDQPARDRDLDAERGGSELDGGVGRVWGG